MGFRTLSISCVKRSANFAAHSLAKYARQIVEELVWLEEPRTPPPPTPQMPTQDARYMLKLLVCE